VAHLMVYTKK